MFNFFTHKQKIKTANAAGLKTSGIFLNKILIVSFLLLKLPTYSYAQTDDLYLQQGIEYYNNDQYAQAIEALTKHLTVYPNSVQGYFYRAYSAAYLYDFKAAKKDFNKAHKISPTDASVLIGLGYLHNNQAKYKQALKYFDKAIKTDPSIADAFNNRGISLQGMGNFREAIKSYSEAIKKDSTMAMAYNNRGSATFYNQDLSAPHNTDVELAIRDFSKAIKYSPNLCVAWRNRGLANNFLKKYDEAFNDLSQAIRCEPQNALNYMNRGIALYNKGEYEKAVSDHMKAIQLYSQLPDAYIEMGKAKSKLGYTEEANNDYLQAAGLNKAYRGIASYNVARNMAMAENKEGTIKLLREAEKNGYFRIKNNWDKFLTEEDFKTFKKDKDFQDFQFSISKKGSGYFTKQVEY